MHKDAVAGVCWLFAGETGRQRDTLLPSHHVLQGCGNAVLGNTHVTCVAGRWFATHQQHVPVCSTRHQNGAAPVSCQLHGAHSEQRTSLYLVASDVLHQFKKSFLNNPNTKQDNVVTIISFCITVFCINSLSGLNSIGSNELQLWLSTIFFCMSLYRSNYASPSGSPVVTKR